MNSSESQPEPDSRMTYFDPEPADTSEDRFALSLQQKAEVPSFTVEPESAPPSRQVTSPATMPSYRDDELRGPDPTSEIAACEAVRHAQVPPALAELTQSPDDWRNLVSAKVNHYRARKPHKERYPSLQLPFPPDLRDHPRRELSDLDKFPEQAATAPRIENLAPVRDLPQPVLLEATARVLEFPRPAAQPFRTDELAEPVLDRPRIIEAPELLPPPPAMGGILIEPPPVPDIERRPGFDLPLQSASLERRMAAAAMDGLIVLSAAAAFAYIADRLIATRLPWRAEALFLGGLVAFLWSAYQYAFLVFCGKTPGLIAARLQMQKFDGALVPRRLRRWRSLVSILSLASLGLGYAWCFFDEDHLSWHDRITKTHLAPAPSIRHV